MILLKNLLNEGNGPLTGGYLDKGISLSKQLIQRGFSKTQAAVIVGNMWAESTFDTTAKNSSGAIGLLQWTDSRQNALFKFAKAKKKAWTDLNLQLDFIKYELLDEYDGEYAYEATMFSRAMQYGDTIQDKAEGFAVHSERPHQLELDKSLSTRQIASKNVYDALTGKKQVAPDSTGKKQVALVSKNAGNLIGKMVYPTKANGYVNVRDEDYVNNGMIDNLIAKITYPQPAGYIKQVVTGKDGNTWYQIVMVNKNTGYVRSDVVTTVTESQYTIQSGDTLTKIAQDKNTTVDVIIKKNPGLQPDKIKVGQQIKI